MLYTIYRVTHKESGKCYIGKHQTRDLNDGYLGSGKMIRRAVKKHGLSAFNKEVLHVFETESEMNAKEAELVTEGFCLREDTYNLCPGGNGGFGYINGNESLRLEKNKKAGLKTQSLYGKTWTFSPEVREKMSQLSKQKHKDGVCKPPPVWSQPHSAATKQKMSLAKRGKYVGELGSQYGTAWITDGVSSKKVKKSDPLPEGFRYGRKMNADVV